MKYLRLGTARGGGKRLIKPSGRTEWEVLSRHLHFCQNNPLSKHALSDMQRALRRGLKEENPE